MNFKPTKLKGGSTVMLDIDSKHTKCKACGKMIKFGLTESGKKAPIINIDGEWQSHFADCLYAKNFRKTKVEDHVDEIERNQNFINNL